MIDKELDAMLPGRRIIPCPFCGGVPLAGRSDKWVYIVCDDCSARGPVAELGTQGKEHALKNAIQRWNWRATDDPAEYWASVIEQAVVNGLEGFNDYARIMAKPGVTFTQEQTEAIKAAMEMGSIAGTARAQRMILDALEKALDT
jgi:Lar family restriction alleviation protein